MKLKKLKLEIKKLSKEEAKQVKGGTGDGGTSYVGFGTWSPTTYTGGKKN